MPIRSRSAYFLISLLLTASLAHAADDVPVRTLTFDGVLPEHRLSLKELANGKPELPADWSDYTHLTLEMRTSSPQRFGLWIYTTEGLRRIEIQPFGSNVWMRACIPLDYLKGQVAGGDLAAATNRRTKSFWMSVWGPWGPLKNIEAVGFSMDYPIHHPTVELRNVHLAKADEGSDFLDPRPVLDEFNQWALTDWPRKIHSREQLEKELADEQKSLGSFADFGYGKFGGYASTHSSATGFFRVEKDSNGKWWFIDPEGHEFLSSSINGIPGAGGFGGRGRGRGAAPPPAPEPATAPAAPSLTNRRLDSWGMTTGGANRPNIPFLRWQNNPQTTFLGLPDVYAEDFAANVDGAANMQCSPHKNDPLVLGYFVGNEPPWDGREPELCDMILKGPDSATKSKLAAFLKEGDTPKRRKEFVIAAFEHYLTTICAAVKKYDPNHLTLGIRFGGKPSDEMLRTGRLFDVCSINVYEYEPTKQVERAYRLTGRPILIGEFHIGVPENGLGAGLVQAMNQEERAKAYRYFVEQAASLDGFLGAHWFTWRDEPVLGRMDGENYNIGFVDVTDRPYPELVEAAKATNKQLLDVHSGKAAPFSEKPKASEVGAPSSPWDN